MRVRFENVDVFESAAMEHRRRKRHKRWILRQWQRVVDSYLPFLVVLGFVTALVGQMVEYEIAGLLEAKIEAARGMRLLLGDGAVGTCAAYVVWILVSVGFALAAGLCVQLVSAHASGSGIPEMKSILSGVVMPQYLSLRTLYAKIFGLVMAFAAGLSVGGEGPFVHIAAIVAYQLSKLRMFYVIRKNKAVQFQMVAAGCAVGVATYFGAPLGGVLFSIEVTTTFSLIANMWKGLVAAVTSSVVVTLLRNIETGSLLQPLFPTSFDVSSSNLELIVFAAMAVVFGLLGVLFSRSVLWYADFRSRFVLLANSRWVNRYAMIAVVAVATAVLTYPLPAFRDTSVLRPLMASDSILEETLARAPAFVRSLTDSLSDAAMIVPFAALLAAFAVAKWLLTTVSIGLSIPCGLYTPIFITGAALGRVVGELLALALGCYSADEATRAACPIKPGAYAVVGAASFATSVTQTLSTSVIVMEITGQMTHALPVLVASLLSYAVSTLFNDSIYDALLRVKKLPYMPPFGSERYSSAAVESVMRPNLNVVSRWDSFADLDALLNESPHQTYPLVEHRENRILLGTIDRFVLQDMLQKHSDRFEAMIQEEEPFAETTFEDLTASLLSRSTLVKRARLRASKSTGDLVAAADSPSRPTADTPPVLRAPSTARVPSAADDLSDEPVEDTVPRRLALAHVVFRREEYFRSHILRDHIPLFDGLNEGLDSAPFQIDSRTPLNKVHFLFTVLGLKKAFATSRGQLVGVVTKQDLMSLPSFFV